MNDICHIPTERLLPNPYQPRHKFDSEEMLSLADSIKENGILQPLLIRRINNSEYYEVIAGERRLRGAILANLQQVPCVELECNTEQSAMLSILENIQRSDLSFFEEATALGQLVNHFGLTQGEIAKKLGKSQSALSNKIRLLKLPPDVRYFIESHGLTERHARALLSLQTEQDIWSILNIIVEKALNVDQTEKLIANMQEKAPKVRRNTPTIYKDLRIFINTVNKAIKTMQASGIEAISDRTETDDYIDFHVRIPKNGATITPLKVLNTNQA